jgi:hypothetical protein
MDSETHVNHSEHSLPVTGATSSAYTDPESTSASFYVKSGSEAESIDRRLGIQDHTEFRKMGCMTKETGCPNKRSK